ncbi:MAG: deoxyribodipyrimidine photo-lyase [Comamonadaceae bacterium]|nr:MAG: deoxyribodipyrimidine photo-lyase [Comamonadaceae bacterium]
MSPILPAAAKTYPRGLMWFRRDLRVDDQAALYHALRSCRELLCVFVFDRAILDSLPRLDRRVEFIRESLVELDAQLRVLVGVDHPVLIVRHAEARHDIPALARELQVQAVFANHDYEPDAVERDAQVLGALANAGIAFHTHKDQVIFEREEVRTQVGKPYTVFTPYKRAWLAKVADDDFYLKPYPVRRHADALIAPPDAHRQGVPTLTGIGFEKTNLAELEIPTGTQGAAALFDDFFERIDRYGETRDFPAVRGPSYLGVHLRHGTVSIRQVAGIAHRLVMDRGDAGAAVWLSELVWRDFYAQLLANFPHVHSNGESRSFKPEYDRIRWHQGKHADALFDAWCQGRTGYPLIDAAMAQINQTGYMHNRLRMVTASFLCKDLGIDWRRGEAYFALHLNDFELASNNGGWQWASSSGCDAQPYFRIFNPISQSQRFDPEGKFIRRYLPQLARLPDAALHAPWLAKPLELKAAGIELGADYPKPVVDHSEAREQTLARYAVVKKVN